MEVLPPSVETCFGGTFFLATLGSMSFLYVFYIVDLTMVHGETSNGW